MLSVGSTAKVDGVDHQKVANAAPAFARPTATKARTQEAGQQTDISAAGRLKSTAAATLDAASRLAKAETWSATKAVSSDESVVQAVGDKARPGTYRVDVDAVAMAQATASATFSSVSTVIGIGTLKIELGSWNGSQTAFAVNPNWPKADVTFGPKDTSLERVRDKINAAGIGVIASVVSDATGSRLVLRSTSSGSANGFKVDAEPGQNADPQAANALAALGFDPSQVQQNGAQLVQPAQDAQVRVDGRPLASPQNLVDDEVSGLSLRIKGTSKEAVSVSVARDEEGIRHDIQAFALTYNELNRQLAQSQVPSSDGNGQAAREIQSRVRKAFEAAEEGTVSTAGRLRAIGVRMGQDGALEVDPAKLARALRRQPQEVESLFAAPGDGQTRPGLAQQVAQISLPENTPKAVAGTPAAPGAAEAASTAAGTLFRQRLLEQQYAPADPADSADPGEGSEGPEGEAAFLANAANAA